MNKKYTKVQLSQFCYIIVNVEHEKKKGNFGGKGDIRHCVVKEEGA